MRMTSMTARTRTYGGRSNMTSNARAYSNGIIAGGHAPRFNLEGSLHGTAGQELLEREKQTVIRFGHRQRLQLPPGVHALVGDAEDHVIAIERIVDRLTAQGQLQRLRDLDITRREHDGFGRGQSVSL